MESLVQLKILKEDELEPGDILLCYSSELQGEAEELQNGYAHTAINTYKNSILESSAAGVKTTDLSSLFEEYGHIAVLRNKELWSEERLLKLDEYANDQIGKKFNSIGMYKVPSRKEKQKEVVMENVEGYFDGSYKPLAYEKNTYFCSELITSTFIHVGIIDESASILLSPEVFSPEDIGRDKAFGFFVGYILPYEGYNIPENDTFRTSI